MESATLLASFLYFAFLISAHATDLPYQVPDPHVEAYSPKGLRVSIPDEKEIKSVQFIFSFRRAVVIGNEPGEVSKKVDGKEGSYWVYWNPSVELRPHDMIEYKIKVLNRGAYAAKEGTHMVTRLISLADNSIITDVPTSTDDCDENMGQQLLQSLPSSDSMEEHNLGVAGTKKVAQQSSYSMLKSVNSKPITRSSTIKTSGTYFVRPEGHVEASGYKEMSSYDSTRRDGEQWQHSKTDLSPAEFENLKLLHGFASPMGLHGLPSNGGAVRGYHQETSYSSTSSHTKPSFSSSSIGQTASNTFDESEHHQIRQPTGSYASSMQTYERQESSKPIPLSSRPINFVESENQAQTSYFPPIRTNPSSSYHIKSEYERHESSSSSAKRPEETFVINPAEPNYNKPITNPIQPPPNPVQTTSVHKETIQEFNSGPVKTIVPSSTQQTKYVGAIFLSPINPAPVSPQFCQIPPGRSAPVDVEQLDRTVKELQCLAALAEHTAKTEVNQIKDSNHDLVRRLEKIEYEFKRYREECKCQSAGVKSTVSYH